MQKCDLTGKGKQYGHNVSFSQRHTKKVWKPNLQSKTVVVNGKKVKMKLSTQAIRTLKKKGLLNPAEQPSRPTPTTTAKPAAKAKATAKTKS
ncbi:MAG TPA: 50S ribosomal protein L28 [Candidatus Saccharimonadales bacterium]|nr:50S ribosomal protein L28 [Candidatus Saccharimonadales bacterium]